MVLRQWHHTIGYGGAALGALLLLVGGALTLSARLKTGRARAVSAKARVPRVLQGRRTQGVIAAAIIVGATLGTFAYVDAQLYSHSETSTALSLSVLSASEVAYPNGTLGVTVQVDAQGGVPPYTYSAQWNDNASQTSSSGSFTRDFAATSPMASGLTVKATGANGWLAYLSLLLPSQFPVSNGVSVNTKTLGVVPSNVAIAPPAGASSTTQTQTTQNFVAVFNASLPTATVTTSTSAAGVVSVSLSSTASQSSSTATYQTSASTTTQVGGAGGNGGVGGGGGVSNSSASWSFVPSYPAAVTVSGGEAYFNVSFTNTSPAPVSAFVDTVVASGGSGSHVPGPVVTVQAGGRMELYVPLGHLAPGTYTVTFFAVDNANSAQISATETIQFTI